MKPTFRIRTVDREKDKEHREYEVDVEPTDRVLDGLTWIERYHGGMVTYRRFCG